MSPYTPRGRRRGTEPDPSQSQTAADGLPADLSAALDRAEQMLEAREQAVQSLHGLSDEIPRVLKRLVSVSTVPESQSIKAELEQRSMDRKGLIAAFVREEVEFTAVRDEIDQLRQGYSNSLAADFKLRYDAAVAALEVLSAEGVALGACLRTELVPVKVEVAPASASPSLPLAAVRIGRVLDQLDSAIKFSVGVAGHIRQVQTFRDHQTARSGLPYFDPGGIFRVVRPGLRDYVTGREIIPGSLVDASLIPAPLLVRHFSVKTVELYRG